MTRHSNRGNAFSGKTHSRTGLAVEEIRSLEGLEAIAPDWIKLADELSVELPFSDFRWMAAWWRNLRRETRLTRDSLCVLAFRRSGRLIGIAPYMVTSRHVLGLRLLRVLQPIGTDPNITEVRGLLVGASDEHDVAMTMVDYARECVACDTIVVKGLSADGQAATDLSEKANVAEGPTLSMFVLPLAATWDALRTTLPRNLRESLRKCRNSLTRDGHVPTFRVLESEAEILALLPRFFELHRNRADAVGTVHHNDVFGRESSREFMAAAVRQFAPVQRIRLFTMEIGGVVVAMRFAFICHDCLYLYYSGYDTEWGKYSVMTSVTAEAVQWAIEANLKRVNFSTGADQSKLRWRPDEIVTRGFEVQGQTLRARVAHRAVEKAKLIRADWEKRQRASASVRAHPLPDAQA